MAKKTTHNTDPNKSLVVQTLIVKPNTRSVLDVGQWRTALTAADFGRRHKLYALYEDVLLDNVLKGSIRKRIYAITNAQLVFMRNDSVVPAIDALIDTQEFEELLTEIMNARFWGKSVIELDFTNGFKPYNIPRQHIDINKGIILLSTTDSTGIPYKNDDFFLEVGQDDDFGAILEAAPYTIYKRGGFGDWAQFSELFGMPFRLGTYAGHDQESRRLLEEALDRSGSASYLVAPKETEVKIVESAAANGGGELFSKLREACNEEILIGILGQTMTTTDGSSHSQSKVHKDVEEDINRADRRFVSRILNHELLPRLEKRGYPVSGGHFYFPDEGESISISDQLNMHIRMKNELGLALDEDWLHEYYSIPKPKGNQARVDKEDKEDKTEKEDKEEKLSDRNFLLQLWERAAGFFVKAPATPGACHECGGVHLTDNPTNDLPLFDDDALIQRVAADEGKLTWDQQLFSHTAGVLTSAIDDAFRANQLAYKPTYGYEPDALHVAYDMNIVKFSATKNIAAITQLNGAFRTAKSFGEFQSSAKEICGVFNGAWLQSEYQTANAAAANSALYWRLKAQAHIFEHWQYVTVDDGLVRPEHEKLHNLILRHDNPAWKDIFPPNGWRCRCRVRPILRHDVISTEKENKAKLDEFRKSKEWKKAKASGFGMNKAITGEIFAANQMYVKSVTGKMLRDINHKTLGLGTTQQNRAKADTPVTKYQSPAEQWKQANTAGGVISLKDYKGRSLSIDEKSFNKHTLENKAYRVQYLEALRETLQKPSEVWLTAHKTTDDFRNVAFIRYYKDVTITVLGTIERGRYKLTTWFPLQEGKESVVNDFRSGLLILKQ